MIRNNKKVVLGRIGLGIGIITVLVVILFGWPIYRVWQQGLSGKAALERAEQERQIIKARAQAEKEAAQDTASAIEIVGAMAQKYPEYREQEFIQAFAEAMNNGKIEKIIYVPTEANIPIIEVSRQLQ